MSLSVESEAATSKHLSWADHSPAYNSTPNPSVVNLNSNMARLNSPSESYTVDSVDMNTTAHNINALVEPAPDSPEIIGKSKKMSSVYDAIAQVAGSETTVLVAGESGVGKEMVARAIHKNSLRADRPFIKINCASFPESMIETELFGHEKGAFNGAMSQRKGRLELAEGGTVFLDEVGDFSVATQAKLLRIMQDREIERIGGTETIPINIRTIAATNRNLPQLIEQGRFREDFYYRLNVFPISVPALRERPADIVLLADHFVGKYNKILGKDVRRISTPAIDMLMTYHWPGNVQEMENCFERAVLISADGVIQSHHLPPTLQTAEQSRTGNKGTLRATLDRVEYELLMDSLKANRGNMAKSARELGMSERVMGLRVRKYKIDCSRF